MSTRATYSSGYVWHGRRCKEKALPSLAPPGAGASGFSVAHIRGAVATGVRVRVVSHVAPDQEDVHIAAASANAIATVARGGRTERARGRSVLRGALGPRWRPGKWNIGMKLPLKFVAL